MALSYNEGNTKLITPNETPDWNTSISPYNGKHQSEQALQGRKKIKECTNTLLGELQKATENIGAVKQPSAGP